MWKLMIILCVGLSTALSAEVNVLAFAGSTREASVNKKLIVEVAYIAREKNANVTLIDLKDYPIPFYDGDLEATEGMPEKAKELRQLIIQNDVIFIASPNYNGSVSAVLKNVLDWASRTEEGQDGRSVLQGKKIAILSASPGAKGGAGGLPHLRSILEKLKGNVMTQQVSIPDAENAFDEQGHLKNPDLDRELNLLIETALN